MDPRLSIHDRRPFSGYVNFKTFRENYHRDQLTEYWNFPHFVLIEPYRDHGSEKMYHYLLELDDVDELVSESKEIAIHPTETNQSFVKLFVAGLHFYVREWPEIFTEFMNYESLFFSEFINITPYAIRYRELFSSSNSRVSHVIIDHERNVTTEHIKLIFKNHDKQKYVDITYIGGDILCGALEFICKKHYLPIQRAYSFMDISGAKQLYKTIDDLAFSSKTIIVGDKNLSCETEMFLNSAKNTGKARIVYV